MGRAAAIGSEPLVRGFALAGVLVVPAEDPAGVRRAWAGLPDDVELVVLTRAAAAALDRGLDGRRDGRLTAVMPA